MLLDAGMAKETARRVLPLCTPTTMYMHGTLRSWIHYIQLRSANGTQLEHQQIALECQQIFARKFPVIAEAVFGAVS
jgi:thymidylate synthase (FAD)